MANLSTDKQLDRHLKPLKSGEDNTSLELATEDNGAKIKGDLEVTGYVDNLKLMDNASLTTTSESADGHLSLDSDGDLIFDSGTGNFIAKKDGTEFSVANSAYAGMILGYTRIQNNSTASGHAVIAVNSSSMTVLQTAQGTDLSVTFKAPPSGNVEIQCSFWISAVSDGAKLALSDNPSFNEIDASHTYDADYTFYIDETDHSMTNVRFAVTGLAAGTPYTYYLGGLASGAGVNIMHGDSRASGDHYPPILLKAIALPATITTGE